MSLQVLVAHTGLSFTPASRFSSLESLQSWIVNNASIDLQDQILMTARGKQVKLQTLSLENEIFVYSRQILSASGQTSLTSSLPTTPCPEHYKPKVAPATPSNKSSVESWQELFDDRSAWAEDLHHRCTKIRESIHQLGQEASVIQRSAAIAVDNVKQHVANLRPKYEDSTAWADNVSHDQTYLLEQWEGLVGKYPSIPTIRALGRCLAGSPAFLHEKSMSSSSESETSLYDFVTISELTRASNAGKGSSQRFRSRANDLRLAYTDVEQKADSIVDSFGRDEQFPGSTATKQADHVLEEIGVVTNKIKADRDFVLGLTDAINPVPHVTRIALLHTRSFIPTLLQTNEELHQLLQRSVEHKNDAQIAGVQYLQDISAVESRIALVHNKLAKLDLDQDDQHVFEILGAGTRLPFIYGLLLVECVQRLEWAEKITADSSSLVEEVATFKEEENQRRKKWIRDMGDVVNLRSLDEMSLGFDINVRTEKHNWPQLTRNDIQSYIKTLRELGGFEDAIKEVQAALVTLDSPTKQQLRRAKAFKNGSIHDTTFGRKSLLLRADDDILQTLKGEKIRMEDKLKSSESRIRKLEDLLHRQSQASRPSSSGNPFGIQAPPIERYNTSPVIGFTTSMAKPPEPASRRSSTSSRRISTYIDSEDKGLGKRIANLEAELSAEKIQSANLQKDAAARLDVEDNLKAQVREAVSTKEDLLGNFEAQQKEFDDERYLLEDENRKLKIRLEEAEDELDRVLGSRDHEARAHALEEELQRIREEANLDLRSSRAHNEALRTEHEALHEANSKLQDQHTKLNARFENVSVRLRDRETVDSEHCAALRSALLQIDPDMVIQNDLRASAKAAEAAIRNQMLNMEEMKELVEKAQTENAALESRLSNQNIEMQDLRDRLGNEEMEFFSTRESLAEYRQNLERTRTDLEQERSDHDELKEKQQATDITVESLQARLTRLDSEILAFQNAQEDFKSRERDLRNTHNLSSDRLRQRGSRADDVCRRMYMHISCLENILEQVGYAVTRQQGVPMTVQKMPKAPSTLGSSGPLPTKAVTETLPSPEYLSWAMCDDPEMEGQWYDRLNEDLQTFDMNVFHEAIVKRIKDAEHLARKWQREARGCREKAHRAQSEANEKIAYRSFKEGDLALFLPTRNQATRPWAAFNVGAPHYFLKEQDSHKLRSRDWLLARISRIEERMVDLSRSIKAVNGDRQSIGDASDGASLDDENPFELSDGLRWYLLDAAEEKPGAPINIGLGKATVASASVDAKGSSIRNEQATKSLLTRSLDSRRSSTNSKKGQPVAAAAVQPDSNANDVDAAGAVPKLADHMPERVDRVAGDQSRAEHSNDAEEEDGEGRPSTVRLDSSKRSLTRTWPQKPATAAQSSQRSSVPDTSSSPRKSSPRKANSPSSPEKPKSRAWNSLWSLDLNLESSHKEQK